MFCCLVLCSDIMVVGNGCGLGLDVFCVRFWCNVWYDGVGCLCLVSCLGFFVVLR